LHAWLNILVLDFRMLYCFGNFFVLQIGKEHMINCARTYVIVGVSLGVILSVPFGTADAAETQVQRGKYLVSVIPCTDCHTPGTFLGKPDMKRYLGGSEVGFEVPGLGVFYAPNSLLKNSEWM
jgi:hypothetical protein